MNSNISQSKLPQATPPERNPPEGKLSPTKHSAGVPSSVWRRGILAFAVVVVLIGAGYFVSRRQPPKRTIESPLASKETPPQTEAAIPGFLDRPLRRDFPLTVSIIGGVIGPDGVTVLSEGSRIQIQVKCGRESYLGVMSCQSGGEVVQLYPNAYQENAPAPANSSISAPDAERVDVTAVASDRVEHIYVGASSKPWISFREQKGPLRIFLPDEKEDAREVFRRFERVETTPRQVSEVVIPYRVVARPESQP